MGGEEPDLLVNIQSEESRPGNFELTVALSVLDSDGKKILKSYRKETDLGRSMFGENKRLKEALRTTLAEMKTNLIEDFKDKYLKNTYVPSSRKRKSTSTPAAPLTSDFIKVPSQEEMKNGAKIEVIKSEDAAKYQQPQPQPSKPAESESDFERVPFERLLTSKDASVAVAQGRNHALLSAKTLTLPNLLRDEKTVELTALTVQIEQTILDLNRETELEGPRPAGSGKGLGRR